MIRGQPKFDGLVVTKIEVNFLGPTLDCKGEAAFVNNATGQTHGWTRNGQWSQEVVAKLGELRALMEMHLGQLHLDGGGDSIVGPATVTTPRGIAPEGGLSEHLGEGIPSV